MFGVRPAIAFVFLVSVAVLVGGVATYVAPRIYTDTASGTQSPFFALAGGGYNMTCPFGAESQGILVDFTEGGTMSVEQLVLRANGTIDDARYGPIPKTIPHGIYTVRLASYVPTLGGSFSNQRWYASFGSGDMVLGVTNPSSDVPENVLMFEDPVTQTLSLNAAAAHVYVQHAGFGTQTQTGEYVIPLCMLLTPAGTGGGSDGGGIQSSLPLTQTVTCPLTHSPNSILIDFTGGGNMTADALALVANKTSVAAQYGPITIPAIPAGPYRVRLASYAPPGLDAEYLHQSWYLFLETGSGVMVGRSEPSGDIPSGVEIYQDTVEQHLALTTAPLRAGARHAAYGKQTPELVVPLCALFTFDPGTEQVESQNTLQQEPDPLPDEETTETTTVVEETYPTCPIIARSGRSIVDFTHKGTVPLGGLTVYADGTSPKSLTVSLPPAAPILPGRYEVRLVATHATDTSDTYEIWYGMLFDSAGGLVGRTPTAKDVPTWEDVFISKTEIFSITRPAVRLLGVHARYPVDTPSPVAILCAAFDRVGDLTEEPMAATTTAPVALVPPPQPALESVPTVTTPVPVVVPRKVVVPEYIENTSNTSNTSKPAPLSVVVPQTTSVAVPEVVVAPEDLGITAATTSISIPLYVVEARERLGTTTALFDRLAAASAEERRMVVEELVGGEGGVANNSVAVGLVRTSDEKAPPPDVSSDDRAQRTRALFALARRNALEQARDTDGDGVSDFDEQHVYHSDPFHPFTARSVLSDGERVLLGLDPTKDVLTSVVSESPRRAGEPLPNIFHVSSIDLVRVTQGTSTVDAVRIMGTSTPHSFVTLYVYSTPIIVTVRADVNGRFEYTLEKTLEDGSHELYLTSVNNTGKVLAKSDPIPFVKTAQAIEYMPVAATVDPVSGALQRMVTLALLGMLAFSVGGIILIGAMRARRVDNESGSVPSPHAEV